jgi:hypothetical protein
VIEKVRADPTATGCCDHEEQTEVMGTFMALTVLLLKCRDELPRCAGCGSIVCPHCRTCPGDVG